MLPLETAVQRVVWQAIENTSQELAIDTRADITLYHGTRGPGKTITQLMRFRRYVGLGYGSYWRGIIFDKEFKNFADIVTQAKRFFASFEDGAVFKESATEYKWTWPTGEELLFRHAKKIGDYDGFHGHEYPFIGWNELTKYPTGDLFEKMMSLNRTSFTPYLHTPHDICRDNIVALNAIKGEDGVWRVYQTEDGKPLPDIRLQVFATTNPSGVGHNWVKKRIIDKSKPCQLYRIKVKVYDPRLKEEVEVVRTQTHIWGHWSENKFLTPAYIATLKGLREKNLKAAWYDGDWNVTAGGALDDLWDDFKHVLPRFAIPKGWTIDRAYDNGSTKPFSVGWWAEANGEEALIVLSSGEKFVFCPQPGSLIQFGEWYGCQLDENGDLDIGSNIGLKMSARKIAQGIKEREIALLMNGWITDIPEPGPADNEISKITQMEDDNGGLDTVEKVMLEEGIAWGKSDKSPGSRINGLQLLRDRLECALTGEGPAIYFMENCKGSILTIPHLPRDEEKPDDVDTESEDHPYDMIRYRCLKGGNRRPDASKLKVQIAS